MKEMISIFVKLLDEGYWFLDLIIAYMRKFRPFLKETHAVALDICWHEDTMLLYIH